MMARMYAQDHATIATPIGPVSVSASGDTLTSVRIGAVESPQSPGSAMLRDVTTQIEAWFAGERVDFAISLLPPATPRGHILRAAIASVGYGETLSYGALARKIGSGARAIGQACARNPFPLIIPCHRILAAGGLLGAYSAGDGPATKQWLIDHEQRCRPAG